MLKRYLNLGGRRKLHNNNKHHNLHSLSNISTMIKLRGMKCVGFVNRMAEGNFEWKPEIKKIIWNTYSWKDNTKWILK